jgi:hypothetical protein
VSKQQAGERTQQRDQRELAQLLAPHLAHAGVFRRAGRNRGRPIRGVQAFSENR